MSDKEKKLLYDISKAIKNINEYIGNEKVFEKYDNSKILQHAVERNLEIMGEAMNQLLKLNKEISITNARRVVDVRNKIIHGYDEVENTQIWSIIINHLPILKKEVNILLK